MDSSEATPYVIGAPEPMTIKVDGPLERAAHLAKCIGTIQSAFGLFGQPGMDARFWNTVRSYVYDEIEDLILEAHRARIGWADEMRGEIMEAEEGRLIVRVFEGYEWTETLDFDNRSDAEEAVRVIKETGELP